jgi:hypothetical protein
MPYFQVPLIRRGAIHLTATTEEHRTGYVKNTLETIDKADTVETLQFDVETWYHEKKEKFEICGDCRKAFKKFMENKEITN